jgi:transposase
MGFLDRALSRTFCRSLVSTLRFCGVGGKNLRPRAYNLTVDDVDGLAILLKVDPEEFHSRLYPQGTFDHAADPTIEFFGTKVRTQYFESTIRRVSPRALAVSPHHRALWELRPFSFDPDTRERLIDRCPACATSLEWSKMYGPSKCSTCRNKQGFLTDLRDHPQPTIEVSDEEALEFAVGLVHPDPEKRAAAMQLVPDELNAATNSDLFEAIIAIAHLLSPANICRKNRVGRPRTLSEFAELTPDRIALAGRALIGGEGGFGILADLMRNSMNHRSGSFGIYKELGPLVAITTDPHVAPAIRSFATMAIERDLARTKDVGIVRKRTAKIGRQAEIWLCIKELSTLFHVEDRALSRLAESGLLETRRSQEARKSPVQMNRMEVMPIVAHYKDAISERSALAMLRVSPAAMIELAERKIIDRVDGAAAIMLRAGTYFTRSSVKAVCIAIYKRARTANSSSTSISLISAVRCFGSHVPWASIIELILAGDIVIRRSGGKSRDWRRNVTVEDLDRFRAIVERVPTEKATLEAWINRDQVMQILGAPTLLITEMCTAGLLNPRPGRGLLFSRAEVEAVAKRYIFGPEMLRRSVFRINHELNRWLQSHGVEPEFRFKGSPIYDRKKFEASLPLLAPVLEKVEKKERLYSIEEKKKFIDAVLGGSSIGAVCRMMGGSRRTIAKWVQDYRTNGEIKGNARLDGYEDVLHSILDRNPGLARKEIVDRLEESGIKVCTSSLYVFMKKLGYFQDSDGNYRLPI